MSDHTPYNFLHGNGDPRRVFSTSKLDTYFGNCKTACMALSSPERCVGRLSVIDDGVV